MRPVVVFLSLVALVSCSRDPNVVKQRYLDNGNKYFDRGKFKEATIMYRNALQKDMRFGPAHYKLALAELKLGRVGPAVQALRRAVELLPADKPEHWDATVKLSEIYLSATLAGSKDKQLLADVDGFVQKLLKRDPKSFDAHRLNGDLLYARAFQVVQAGRKEDSEAFLKSAIESYETADKIKPGDQGVSMQLARAYLGERRFAESERLFRGVLEKDKTFHQVYTELYRMLLAQNKVAEGEQVLRQAVANNPKQVMFLTFLAFHYHLAKNRDEMVKVLNQIKSQAKEFSQAYLTVGDFYLRLGEAEEAIKQYREGIAADAKMKSTYQKRIIEVLMRQGKRPEAAEINAQILKENPNDNDARGLQASLMLDRGDVAKALAELQAVVTRAPDNPVARFQLGRAHALRGEWEQARQQFAKAIELRPDYILARLALGQLQLTQRQFDAAIKTARDVLAIDKQSAAARLIESAALMGLQRYSESRSVLADMAKTNPSSPDVLFQTGVVNLAERKYQDAEDAFRRAYRLNPANSRGLMGVVETYMAQNKTDQALALLQSEAEKTPSRLDFRLAAGNTAVRAGRYDLAIAEYNKVLSGIEKDSRASGDVYLRLGETYRRKGDLGGAVGALQKAREQLPGNTTVLSTLALTLDAAGRKQEARQVYEQTIKIEPGNAIVLNNLAFLMAETGSDLDQALTMAQRAKQLLPNLYEVSDTLGWIYLKKNLSDNAIQIFRDLVEKQPKHSTYRYHLGMAFSQKGDKPRAIKELQEALKSNPPKEEKSKIEDLIAKLG
jgi:tetratricopeptide (TPR) repeat protein